MSTFPRLFSSSEKCRHERSHSQFFNTRYLDLQIYNTLPSYKKNTIIESSILNLFIKTQLQLELSCHLNSLHLLLPQKTALGRYRVLSPLAGIQASPLQLGAMSIGDKWESFGMGSMDKESSFKLLDAFFDAGGNFIDTANN